jgi:transcriptional regulator with XRE-family HTH domain
MLKQTSPQLAHRKREIAQRIRQVRRRKGWTQEKAADLLGCSRKRYNSMERGRTELGVTEIDLLAQVFDVPVGFFFERPDNRQAAVSQS